MRNLTLTALAALGALSGPALAGQNSFTTPATAPLLPVVLYEVDYANHGPTMNQAGAVLGFADTVISIGLPFKTVSSQCNLQVAWFDWNSPAPVWLSGPVPLPVFATTAEFTSSPTGAQNEYPPFTENVFSNVPQGVSFEGFAQIRTDKCTTEKLRVDAEFVTATSQPGGFPTLFSYKPINVTNVKGATGY